ncbi:unnamed protein product [Albugo candida]|uniref:WRKY19-like zinc finger domain-containing protein n=1 Tax=Albugo candida TaxID=65357 RepID=A0A024GDH7_9STRA|nr:unnamed protein product [Albugo candida]|eukprot:CCI44886.1 unnamed protein product [Albugo candida]
MSLAERLGKPFERFSFRFHKKQKEDPNTNSYRGTGQRSHHQSNQYGLTQSQPHHLFPSPNTITYPVSVITSNTTAPFESQYTPSSIKYEQILPSAPVTQQRDQFSNNRTCDPGYYEICNHPLTSNQTHHATSTSLSKPPAFTLNRVHCDSDIALSQEPFSHRHTFTSSINSQVDVSHRRKSTRVSLITGRNDHLNTEPQPNFSSIMEEWMNQLKTPTPDVTLLPSPFDYCKDTPTPLEKIEDIERLQDALLPSPTPDLPISNNNHNQQPLIEDIASICRDLISQDISDYKHTKDINESNASVSSPQYHSNAKRCKRRKLCASNGCTNLSRSRGLCKAHGGGRRCSVDGCTRASQSGSLCITHGGGKRCTVEGCTKAAQSRGMCKAHGGGVRCRVEGCTKSSQGDGFCRSHGGGRRCGHSSGCTKWAQRNGMCMAHSEGRYGKSYRGRMHRLQGGCE